MSPKDTDAQECKTILLSDLPSSDDQLGGHNRLAQLLADLISGESEARSIGLEGGWGSGKTTVIRMLRQRLEEPTQASPGRCSLFIFDAWAHEGDPLRRAFLDSLLGHLMGCKWLPSEKWETKRSALRYRSTTESKQVEPTFATIDKLLIISFFLTPLGLAILNAGIRTLAPVLEPALPINWPVVLGLPLALAPLLLILTYNTYASIRHRSQRRSLASVWALLMNRIISHTTTTTIASPEPSTLEFDELFVEAVGTALSDTNRRLVIVIDNLDRISDGDARDIWATMQTFLQPRSAFTQPGWQRHLWVIIPYDPTGIASLWEAGAQPPAARTDKPLSNQPESTPIPPPPSPASHRAQQYLQKTFQIVASVPPPVLSSWKDYFLNLLRQALPNHRSDHHAIYTLLWLDVAASHTTPTPRDLKQIVNGIVLLHHLWGCDLPTIDLAYHVLLARRYSTTDILSMLRAGQVPTREARAILSAKVDDHLAAILFACPVELARQLRLLDPIRASLSTGDAPTLRELSTAPGFYDVLEGLNFRDWIPDAETTSLANAALCIQQSGLIQQSPTSEQRRVVYNLRSAFASVPRWNPFDSQTADGLAACCELVGDLDFATAIIGTVSNSAVGWTPAEGSSEETAWVDGLIALLSKLRAAGLLSKDVPPVNFLGAAPAFPRLCVQLDSRPEAQSLLPMLRPAVPHDAVTNSLIEAVSVQKFSEAHATAVEVGLKMHRGFDWNSVLVAIAGFLGSPRDLPMDELTSLLRAMWKLQESLATKQPLHGLSSQGFLLHHAFAANNAKRYDVACRCLMLMLADDDKGLPSSGQGNATAGHQGLISFIQNPQTQFVVSCLEVFRSAKRLDLLKALIRIVGASGKFLALCLKHMGNAPDRYDLLDPDLAFSAWTDLAEQFGEDFGPLLDDPSLRPGLIEKLSATEFSATLVPLYRAMAAGEYGDQPEFSRLCSKVLSSIPENVWLKNLRAESETIHLLAFLCERNVQGRCGLQYQDALISHAGELADGKREMGAIPGRVLLQWVGDLNERRICAERLYGVVVKSEGSLSRNFLQVYGDEPGLAATLRNDPKAIESVVDPALAKRNAPLLRWALDAIQETNPSNYDDAWRIHVSQRINELNATSPDESLPTDLKSEISRLTGWLERTP